MFARLTAALVALALLTLPSWAHYPTVELWGPAIIEAGEPLPMSLVYGHPFMSDVHSVPDARAVRVRVSHAGRKPRDVTAKITTSTVAGVTRCRLNYVPRREGTYVFGWECGRFQEGQRVVRDFAKVALYARHGHGAQAGWDREFGHPLEILPLTRPFAIPTGSVFRGRVVTHSEIKGEDTSPRPFPGAVIEAETRPLLRGRDHDLAQARLCVKADPNGVFAVTLPRAGWWLVSCATDGGAGEQGTSSVTQKRAVFWVHVGDTVYDTPDPDPKLGKALTSTRVLIETSGSLEELMGIVSAALDVPVTAYGIDTSRAVSLKIKGTPADALDQLAAQLKAAWRRDGEGIEFFMP